MVVVADRLTGTRGDNSWQLVTAAEHAVTTDGRCFTIAAANGAMLRGTVVCPAGAKIETLAKELSHEINYHGGHQAVSFRRKIIRVHGSGQFLVILTVRRGVGPEVKPAADGHGAAVGGRTVRFDGKRLAVEGR